MSSHAINDRFSLLTHHHYSDRIRADPSLIAEATARVNGLIESGTDTIGHRMWRSLLVLDLQHVLKTMVQDDPDGRMLRSNSPFSRLIGYKNVSKRNLLWRQAKREVAANRDIPDPEPRPNLLEMLRCLSPLDREDALPDDLDGPLLALKLGPIPRDGI
jgi:hypothetical protein